MRRSLPRSHFVSQTKVKVGAGAFVTVEAFPERRFPGKVVDIGRRMGRKNVRTDEPTERLDTKILEVVVRLGSKGEAQLRELHLRVGP